MNITQAKKIEIARTSRKSEPAKPVKPYSLKDELNKVSDKEEPVDKTESAIVELEKEMGEMHFKMQKLMEDMGYSPKSKMDGNLSDRMLNK